jgi:hypothetical protein
VPNVHNMSLIAAVDVLISLNFAVVFDFMYFRFRPSKAKSIGNPRIRIRIRIHTIMSWIRNIEFYLRIRGTAHQRTVTCPSRAAPAHSLQRASEALRRCPDRYTYFYLAILLTIHALLFLELQGEFLDFFFYMYGIQHCFICHPLRFHCSTGLDLFDNNNLHSFLQICALQGSSSLLINICVF